MQKYFFIKVNGRFVKINYGDIHYIEGARNYLKIVTEKRNYLLLMSMQQMVGLLPSNWFVRVHRSYIISLDHVNEFTKDMVFLKDKSLPIGCQYKGQLEKAVNIFPYESFDQPITMPVTYLTPKAYAV